ncbi:hypothetical protein PACTADRAFT_79087 [Pachysolen tannophilus NRRL Y-2460]|uniref:3-deoxy-7-phosphoheptulonate synthase n=1 Tax=Pachysolen tannophilus NRRL Y-2460 TaxID=669874 RepID=A0A1E4TY39_PACTA|nr:hypothetical protein PACTADRAFT_79087 [Pachysolen tannophilus NRRL Y-2460]
MTIAPAGNEIKTADKFPTAWDYGTTSERGQIPIVQPEVLQSFLFPISEILQEKIIFYRTAINNILDKDEKRSRIEMSRNEMTQNNSSSNSNPNPMLVITGPKYITNPIQAKNCAQWISIISGKRSFDVSKNEIQQSEAYDGTISQKEVDCIKEIYTNNESIDTKDLLISMRTNLNKYNLDYNNMSDYDDNNNNNNNNQGQPLITFEIENGIPICRALLCELAQYCPLVGELSDTLTPQYLSDLFCLGIVESSLTESQLHRELASGVSYPVGFHTEVSDDSFSFKVDSALDAIFSSSFPHHFLSITKLGTVSIVGTSGNSDTFVILSLSNVFKEGDNGGVEKDILNVEQLFYKITTKLEQLDKDSTIVPRIMIDIGKLSNSNFDCKYNLLTKIIKDNRISMHLLGVMIDSGENYLMDGYSLIQTGLKTSNATITNPLGINFDFNNLRDKMNNFITTNANSNANNNTNANANGKINGNSSLNTHESFTNANRMIHKLAELSRYRSCGEKK